MRRLYPFFWSLVAGLGVAVSCLSAAAPPVSGKAWLDFSNTTVLTTDALAGAKSMAATLLIEEVAARSGLRWNDATRWPDSPEPVIWLGTEEEVSTLPSSLREAVSTGQHAGRPEGFRVVVMVESDRSRVLVIGHDAQGALYGAGLLLRRMRMSRDRVEVPAALDVATAPRLSLRGHQLGYRAVPNSYDAWDVGQWEQYYRDLIVFGANAIELVSPETNESIQERPNRLSPLFPRPQAEMMVEMSSLADKYDLDVWMWYPAVGGDYSDPAVVKHHLAYAEDIFRTLPRLDDLFVPGGDPGYTHPDVLMPFLEKKVELLRRYHPEARLWVSPQGFGAEWLDIFIRHLEEQSPDWLAGIVYGPGVVQPLATIRERVPSRYPIRSYPDITHTFHCQYPVPEWDLAYALTEGREPINPRPLDQAAIFHFELDHIDGVLTYSEGCTDDVNKAVWSGLAWDPDTPVIEILRDYGRYFIGPEFADDFAHGLLALERNWRGPLLVNSGVRQTLQQFQEMERRASPKLNASWRFQQALYRAYYDAFIQRRLEYETELERRALDTLAEAPRTGVAAAIQRAARLLDKAVTEPAGNDLRTRVHELAGALYQGIGLQLSVDRYGALLVNRGANLDMIDFPLNNRLWLQARFAGILAETDEEVRLEQIRRIVEWTNPGPGGFYDDLGDSRNEPHLVRGPGVLVDPGVLRSPADDFELIKEPAFYNVNPYRYSWLRRASTLHGTPLRLRYDRLDPTTRYRVRVVYPADRDDFVPRIRLTTDDGHEVHPFIDRPIPAAPLEFPIPAAATADGELVLELNREAGDHGNGRGAQMAEVWLLKETKPVRAAP